MIEKKDELLDASLEEIEEEPEQESQPNKEELTEQSFEEIAIDDDDSSKKEIPKDPEAQSVNLNSDESVEDDME